MRRKDPRRDISYLTKAHLQDRWHSVRVLNRSEGGLLLEFPAGVEASGDDTIKIEMPHNIRTASIRWVGANGERVLIGVEFDSKASRGPVQRLRGVLDDLNHHTTRLELSGQAVNERVKVFAERALELAADAALLLREVDVAESSIRRAA